MRLVPGVALLGFHILNGCHGSAQAWLPAKGEGSASTTFQHVYAAGHFLEDGSRLPGYETRASNLLLDVAYGVTDRLAVSVALPYMNVKYAGKEEPFNLPENKLDDGNYHGAFQDFGFELRYNAFQRPFMATPFVAAGVPSHAYETIGEAAVGRDLRELRIGTYAGRLLEPVLPRTYVHGMYSYAFVERDQNIPLDRSNLNVDVGYFVTPAVSLSFLWRRQWTHGGLDFAELFAASPEIFRNFDRLVRQDYQHVGVGAGFPLTRTLSGHLNFIKFVSGKNAHYGSGIAGGVNWSFQTPRGQTSARSGGLGNPALALRTW